MPKLVINANVYPCVVQTAPESCCSMCPEGAIELSKKAKAEIG